LSTSGENSRKKSLARYSASTKARSAASSASGARRRRSKLRQRRRAAGTLVLYRRRPSGVHGQQILAVTRDHLGIAVAAADLIVAHPSPIAGGGKLVQFVKA